MGSARRQTYVPGLRHCVRFENAYDLGRSLDAGVLTPSVTANATCKGAFENGQHPLDLLLEDEFIPFKNGRGRKTPTSRAVGVNTWHYLLSRRAEIDRFSVRQATDVIKEDIERAAVLGDQDETHGLRRLANELSAASMSVLERGGRGACVLVLCRIVTWHNVHYGK